MSDDIRRWLEELNLGQFAESFAANGIELSLLPDLNNDDLKDMGVARVADRKKVLNAIAALKAPVPPAHAERRQLSVMFCDLVGSTELSARLDPEDMREVLRRYQDTVAGVIIRHDGYVANYLGDGVLAYFGWPTAHEDQAQRAVRAALGAVAAVGEIRTPADQPLAARAGIATGQVVVGDLETETGRQSGAISGETPNRAAGIQGEAAPGEVFIGAATRRLLGTAFQVTERGERKLKGLVEPEALWAVAGETFVESRFAAQHRGSLTPFIGREREVDLLAERWRRAHDGQGQVVSLSGEAGIGKSRLVQVTREHAAVQDPTVLQYQCAPSFANSAFYPFVQQLGHAAGFAKDDAPDQKLDKLETVTGGSARPAAQTHSLLAAMMQIPIGERYPPLKLTPDQMLHETGSVLVEQLHALAEQRPVLMIFEDLHWADGNSLALLERTIAALSTWPVLAVFTYRPEFEPSWQPSDHHAVVALERLDRDRCRDMVLRVSGDARLPDAVLDQILDKTDGVPLFVEELVKTVLESDVAADAEAGAGGEWASLAIPSTLQDSLIARLDRLSPVREIAQIGSVIGREFGYDLLADISPLGENELRNGLAQLVSAELLFRRGRPPNEEFLFKHALVRDAAYDGILKSRRRQIHKAVAEAIEARSPEARATQPELLAQHYEEAGLALNAIPLWIAASQSASTRAAYADGVQHAERGLRLFANLPEAERSPKVEIDLLSARAISIIPVRGYGDPQVSEACDRIAELSAEVEDSPELLPSLFWVSVTLWNAGDIQGTSQYLDRMLRIADRSNDLRFKISVNGYAGPVLVHVPDFEKSRACTTFVVENYDPEMHEELNQLFGQNLGVNGHSWHSLRLAFEGLPEQGMQITRDAVDLARRYDHPFNFPLVLLVACWTAHVCCDRSAARAWAEESVEYCTDRQVLYWLGISKTQHALANLLHGDPTCNVQEFEEVLAMYAAMGVRIQFELSGTALALANEEIGNAARCDELLAEASVFGETYPDFYAQVFAHLLRGQIFERRKQVQKAAQSYRAMHDLSAQAGARLTQLRGAVNLARLMRDDGQLREARDLLSPLYESFTEGHGLPDLIEAKARLKDLA